MNRRICSVGLLLLTIRLSAAVVTCPAGGPIGNVRLEVTRTSPASPIPLARVNRIEEGDEIRYLPVLRPNEKRHGKVTAVLVAAVPTPDQKNGFAILEPKDADKPATWKAPFRPSLVVYVYGPDGVSTRKLEGFLSKDDQLIAQLADYAEKTAQTEAVLQALATYEHTGASENLGAALQGFASRQGTEKIDRSAPLEQQTLSMFRSLNPALSGYDPIAPPGPQRISQTAGLATTVAGMFLGSTVGLAAGSASMALNLKSILMPNTEFRSAFAQPGAPDGASLCGRRDPSQTRSRLAYLWALRLPASGPPALTAEEPRYLPAGLKATVRTSVSEGDWKLITRARDWTLQGSGRSISVPVTPLPASRELEVDLSKAEVPPGTYHLAGKWDWDEFRVGGDLVVQPLSNFEKAELTPASRNKLRQHSGKEVVQLEGDDFQFVRKVTLVRKGDRYGTPSEVPFSLPAGYRRGPQPTLEMQIDTSGLTAGEYSLQLFQKDDSPVSTTLQVLPDPPRLEGLPLQVHVGEETQQIELQGKELDRITKLEADGVRIDLADAQPGAGTRRVQVHAAPELKAGTLSDIRMYIRNYGEPVLVPAALHAAAPRPRILDARIAPPSGLAVEMREGELAAGQPTSAMLRIEPAENAATVHLSCSAQTVSVASGAEKTGVRLQIVEPGSLFLSFDPGLWPGGCTVRAAVETAQAGRSNPKDLGRVVRIPQIESFRLTDEQAGDGGYFGVLTGRNLELIDRTGWDATNGQPVPGLPAPVAGDANRQQLKVRLNWPSPVPHAPIFIWLRGEEQGRQTTARY